MRGKLTRCVEISYVAVRTARVEAARPLICFHPLNSHYVMGLEKVPYLKDSVAALAGLESGWAQ